MLSLSFLPERWKKEGTKILILCKLLPSFYSLPFGRNRNIWSFPCSASIAFDRFPPSTGSRGKENRSSFTAPGSAY